MPKLTTLKSKLPTLALRLPGMSTRAARFRGRPAMRRSQAIKLRDQYTCAACGLVGTDLEVDHVVPLHLGGADDESNLQLLCIPCHQAKSRSEASDRASAAAAHW